MITLINEDGRKIKCLAKSNEYKKLLEKGFSKEVIEVKKEEIKVEEIKEKIIEVEKEEIKEEVTTVKRRTKKSN
jgi:hypothetical protein